MRAMILAAGLGTRLRPLTDHCPKPLLPLVLQPLLGHLLQQLYAQGIREVVVNAHHHAAQLVSWLGDGSRWGLRVLVSVETDILGTAGALKRVEPFFQGAPFLVLNADVVADVDLRALWLWHQERPDALVTMVLRPDAAARAYGPVLVNAQGQVVRINGRPPRQPKASMVEETIFTGIQVVAPAVLAHIPATGCVSTTADVYPALLAQSAAIYGYRYTGYWMDIGVPERYLQAHWDILDGRRGDTWMASLPPLSRVIYHTDAGISDSPGATLYPPVVLGPHVTLAAGAQVGPYVVLGAGCQIEAGALIRESVIGERGRIGARAQVRGCIVGTAVQVPSGSVWTGAVRSCAGLERE